MQHKNTHKKSRLKTLLVTLFLVGIALVIVFFNNTSSSSKNTTRTTSESAGSTYNAPIKDIDTSFADEIAPSFEQEVFVDTAVQRLKKTASLSLRVNNVDTTTESIRSIARTYGGDVMSARFSHNNNLTRGYITVKVRTEDFDKALTDIKDSATLVQSESIDTQDVTAQYADLEADLGNKKSEEQAFLQILERAETVEDAVTVQEHLSRVRGEIERLEGRKRLLENQTDYSTITVNMTEDTSVVVSNAWRPGQVAADSVNTLIKRFQIIISTSIALAITSLPLFLLSVIGLVTFYVITKKIIAFMLNYIKHKK